MGNVDWEFNALDELRKRIDKLEYERIRKQKEWADGEAREKAQDEARKAEQKQRDGQAYRSAFGRDESWGYSGYTTAEDYARASSGWFGQDQQPRSRAQEPAGIPQDKLLELIKLCHPDKHANSPASTEITKWLLAQRKG